ncbi:MAG: hypothetical protein K2Z80_29380 [Xanthobacteraceae bacterium]|nr:hypothetical protein [Xanthobacteraceae bacterium]
MERVQKISEAAFLDSATRFVPRDSRVARGKALRDRIPRKQHGRWKELKDRPDPIDIIREEDTGRMKELVPIRELANRSDTTLLTILVSLWARCSISQERQRLWPKPKFSWRNFATC